MRCCVSRPATGAEPSCARRAQAYGQRKRKLSLQPGDDPRVLFGRLVRVPLEAVVLAHATLRLGLRLRQLLALLALRHKRRLELGADLRARARA